MQHTRIDLDSASIPVASNQAVRRTTLGAGRAAPQRDSVPVAEACFMCAWRPGALATLDGLACLPCVQLCVHLVVRRCGAGAVANG